MWTDYSLSSKVCFHVTRIYYQQLAFTSRDVSLHWCNFFRSCNYDEIVAILLFSTPLISTEKLILALNLDVSQFPQKPATTKKLMWKFFTCFSREFLSDMENLALVFSLLFYFYEFDAVVGGGCWLNCEWEVEVDLSEMLYDWKFELNLFNLMLKVEEDQFARSNNRTFWQKLRVNRQPYKSVKSFWQIW